MQRCSPQLQAICECDSLRNCLFLLIFCEWPFFAVRAVRNRARRAPLAGDFRTAVLLPGAHGFRTSTDAAQDGGWQLRHLARFWCSKDTGGHVVATYMHAPTTEPVPVHLLLRVPVVSDLAQHPIALRYR